MQQTDHDTLIRVETKVDSLVNEVKASSTLLGDRVADHELRLRSIEKIHDQVDPIESSKQLDALVTAQSTSGAERRTIAGLSAAVAALVTLLASIAAAVSGIVSIHK
ncbi:hypothetical protein SAMN04487914_10874 [Arthrobacter sp. ok909]|uniref:hypothetical protein n=1 Tax=Arthrobacter sp. ok909 TaxID=1761746 RepID=UPI00088E8DDD|nr:hypothetical protein [Arthrobacter sp. ok909]SDP32932.1 hypothetical protein SAMN04487914_10874 [Arthrobacter sp. ok909]